MNLPGVYIEILNGQIGGAPGTDDGVSGLICTGVALSGKIELNEPKQLFSLDDAKYLGITKSYDTDNGVDVHKQISDFYAEAGKGSELWLMLVDSTVSMAEMLNKDNPTTAVKLLNKAKGSIRLLSVDCPNCGIDEIQQSGLNAQKLSEDYTQKIQPFRVILPGNKWSGDISSLANLREMEYNRVSVVLLSTGEGQTCASSGLVLGRLASIPVQRNCGRVKSGALPLLEAYMTDGKASEDYINAYSAIHAKGYIFARKYPNKSGYYLNDDPTATKLTDDYNSIARGRVIDKAFVLTYSTFIEEVNDEVAINDDGTLSAAYVKSVQGKIENVINQSMTANGEISSVSCTIDPLQNILATNVLDVYLFIVPVGYAKEIRVKLGFTNPLNKQ